MGQEYRIKMKYDLGDIVAASMQETLESDEFKKIFEKPKVAVASAPVVEKVVVAKAVVDPGLKAFNIFAGYADDEDDEKDEDDEDDEKDKKDDKEDKPKKGKMPPWLNKGKDDKKDKKKEDEDDADDNHLNFKDLAPDNEDWRKGPPGGTNSVDDVAFAKDEDEDKKKDDEDKKKDEDDEKEKDKDEDEKDKDDDKKKEDDNDASFASFAGKKDDDGKKKDKKDKKDEKDEKKSKKCDCPKDCPCKDGEKCPRKACPKHGDMYSKAVRYIVDSLNKTSAALDEMGLEKSSMAALHTLDMVVREVTSTLVKGAGDYAFDADTLEEELAEHIEDDEEIHMDEEPEMGEEIELDEESEAPEGDEEELESLKMEHSLHGGEDPPSFDMEPGSELSFAADGVSEDHVPASALTSSINPKLEEGGEGHVDHDDCGDMMSEAFKALDEWVKVAGDDDLNTL